MTHFVSRTTCIVVGLAVIPSGLAQAPPDKAVQFNAAGSFGGDATFLYDSALHSLRAPIVNAVRYANAPPLGPPAGGDGTLGNPWTGWESSVAVGRRVVFPPGYYRPAALPIGLYSDLHIDCAPGAVFLRPSGNNANAYFAAVGSAVRTTISGCTFDSQGAVVTESDILFNAFQLDRVFTDIVIENNNFIGIDARTTKAIIAFVADYGRVNGVINSGRVRYSGNRFVASTTVLCPPGSRAHQTRSTTTVVPT